MKFNRMKMQRQLLLGFAISLVIFIVAVATAYVFLVKAANSVDAVVDNRYPKIMSAQQIIKRTIDNGRALRAAAMAEDAAEIDAGISKITGNMRPIGEEISRLGKAAATPKGQSLTQAMQQNYDRLGPLYDQAFVLIRSGERSKSLAFMKEVGAANNALWQSAEAFGKYQEDSMATVASEAKQGVAIVQTTLLVSTLLAVAISIALAVWLSGTISRRLGLAVEMAEAIAHGRLDTHVSDDGTDEIADLLAAMSQMQQGLNSLVVDIQGMVSAAEQGDLGRRMTLNGRQGFGLAIGESLNRLVGTVDTSLRDIAGVAGALANGDLSQQISQRYAGAFGETAQAVNRTVQALKGVIGEVRDMVDAASAGNFSRHIELAGKQGYGRELADLLNRLALTANEALADISRVAQALAQGDLTCNIDKRYPGLFGQAADGINVTSSNLRTLIGEIAEAVDMITTAAQEIAAGNQDLSGRTEEQASSLEETASSMEELTSTVKQNSDSAGQASDLAGKAREVAVRGGDAVQQVVGTMSAIHESSSRIANIIGVIDSIAFQTNILALNAAVEAARAGEQGRGFAVVATEVRNLAQRSATAAKEIKELIADSVRKVEDGNQQVERAGRTMAEVVRSIQEVAAIMADISSASREQTTGIQQVGLAVSQMDQVTQQNAALVEQAAAAAESLEDQARNLALAVGHFKRPGNALPAPQASTTSFAALPPARGVRTGELV